MVFALLTDTLESINTLTPEFQTYSPVYTDYKYTLSWI